MKIRLLIIIRILIVMNGMFVFALEPKISLAPLSYFGYFDDHGDKVTKLVVGEEYFIKAKFFWPESYSQPYEFLVEIHDDKSRKVIQKLTARGMMAPNDDMEVYFSWIPKETGNFRNYSELWATDTSSVITDIPQYDFEVIEPQLIQEVNYVDFRDAKGEIIEVGCSSGLRASENYNFGDAFLDSLKCNSIVTLILVLMLLGIMVGVIFIVWRKRK